MAYTMNQTGMAYREITFRHMRLFPTNIILNLLLGEM